MPGKAWKALAPRNLELGPVAGAPAGRWRHWRMARDGAGVAWLVLDKEGTSANTLDAAVLGELAEALTELGREQPKGLVIRSAKPSGFIAGADIGMFRGTRDAASVESMLVDGHRLLDSLEKIGFPTVALVHGFCLGGGLELALACRYRVAVAGARFGFPEVLLGLHPGLGGTARSTSLIDPVEAMKLMLTGRTIDARRARSLGLVHAVTEERHVEGAVAAAVAGTLKSARRGLRAMAFTTAPGRRFAARRMRAEAAEKAPPQHYPAPGALIDLWEEHGDDADAMKRAEMPSFAKLLVGDTAQNLVRVFFLRETLKAAAKGDPRIEHVHVVGAGAMGGDIASWCAMQGLKVTLGDLDAKALGRAIGRASRLYARVLRDRPKVRDALDRLTPDLGGAGIARADLVIEAVPERLDLKRRIYAELEPRMKPGALLATNTSSIRLEELSEGLARPGQFVGLHFFNPVSRMQLVEVVRHPGAARESLDRATAFTGRIDRLPVEVASAPGFLVNRALLPYLVEAFVMIDEGVAAETIDRAVEAFGMPMGPIELADQVGLDVALDVARLLSSGLGEAVPEAPRWLAEKVEKGELGRKTGKGFYEWKDDKAIKTTVAGEADGAMTDRLILPILNACVACLSRGVVSDPDAVDGAMVFGTGFAPFRGGPLHYARARGIDDVVATLRTLEARHGGRFTPDEGWEALKTPEAPAG